MLAQASQSVVSVPAAIGLGALQGIAEFLPISSSGHLALAQTALGINPEHGGHTFSIVLHAGTLLAVLVTYRRDLRDLAVAALHANHPSSSRSLLVALAVATAPLALAMTAPIKELVTRIEGDISAIGYCFWFTAFALLVAQWLSSRKSDRAHASWPPTIPVACLIGIAQLVAVLPGISRSGSTIAAALSCRLDRPAAARFSFLLSIPAIAGATLLEARHVLSETAPSSLPWTSALVGFAVSAVVGFATLQGLIRMLERVGVWPFIPYLAVLGLASQFFAR